jgi:hypothetical protein
MAVRFVVSFILWMAVRFVVSFNSPEEGNRLFRNVVVVLNRANQKSANKY